MKKEKKHSRILKIILIIWGVGAIVFAKYDLPISINIVNTGSIWANTLEKYGEAPGIFVIVIALLILTVNQKISKRIIDMFLYIVYILFSVLALNYLLAVLTYRLPGMTEIYRKYGLLTWPLLLGIIFVIKWIFKKSNIVLLEKHIQFAKVAFAMGVVNILLLVQVLKTFWGRVRFRELDSLYANFTPWYLPQGITGYKSFPSGHTAFGWMLLPIMILISTTSKKVKNITVICVLLWGVSVGLSRIVTGAHYASDVLFASGFSIVLYILFYRKYFIASGRQ